MYYVEIHYQVEIITLIVNILLNLTNDQCHSIKSVQVPFKLLLHFSFAIDRSLDSDLTQPVTADALITVLERTLNDLHLE